MADDKITHDMISDGDPFKDVTSGAERALDSLVKLEGGIKGVVKALSKGLSGDPKTMSDLKSQVESIRSIEAGERALNEVGRQKLLLTQAINAENLERKKREQELTLAFKAQLQAEKDKANAAKKAAGAYADLSKKHRELVKEVKDLAAAGKTDTKMFKDLTKEANKLGDTLKKIDASVGQHQRNVGNYTSAWSQLKEVAIGAAVAFGVRGVANAMKETIESFVEAEKNAHALGFALRQVGGEGEAALQKLLKQSEELQATGGVFSDDEIQQAQTQLVNFGLLSDEVEQLMPKILDLATAQGVDLATATDTVIKGINGQTRGLKSVGLGFEDTGDAAKNYQIILDGLTKFEGAAAEAATTTEGKYKVLMNRFDDLKEQIGEFLINEGAQYLDYWDILFGKMTVAQSAQKKVAEDTSNAFAPLVDKTLEEANALDTQAEKMRLLSEKSLILLNTIKKLNEERRKANQEGNTDLFTNLTGQIEGVQAQNKRLMDAMNVVKNGEQKSLNERVKLNESAVQKETTNYEDEWQKSIDEVNKKKQDADADEEDLAKLKADHDKHRMKLWLEDQDKKQKREEAAYKLRKEKRDKEQAEERRKMEELIKINERIIGAVDEGLDERYNKREDEIKREGDMIDEQLRIQSERQLQGLDNTYSETLKLKEENDAKLAALEEARRRKEEAVDLAELFIELTKANAKDGDAQNAAMKALAQTIAIKALKNTIAGNFATGVENFKGKGGPTDDANIIGFSSGESVVTARGTAETPGLVTAVNESGKQGAVDWVMENLYKPQYAAAFSSEDLKGSKVQSDWTSSLVLNELMDVNKTLKELPKKQWGYDETEKAFYSIEKNNGKTTKTIKRRF